MVTHDHVCLLFEEVHSHLHLSSITAQAMGSLLFPPLRTQVQMEADALRNILQRLSFLAASLRALSLILLKPKNLIIEWYSMRHAVPLFMNLLTPTFRNTLAKFDR